LPNFLLTKIIAPASLSRLSIGSKQLSAVQRVDWQLIENVATPSGWQARLDLEYELRGAKTRLTHKRQRGPLALQRSFYPEGNTCHSYLLHPPGGVVGGDSLQINVSAGAGAHSLLTAPGATKFYRCAPQQIARQTQRISVADGGVVEWLPQPNIFFDGANATLATHIDIAPGARFIGWELHCFGRPASQEPFACGSVRSQTHVHLAGELRLLEQFNTHNDDALLTATGLRGLAMQGSFIAAPCNDEHRRIVEQILLSQVGEQYPHPCGLTLVDEVLIVRALGQQAEPMLALFTRLWTELRGEWLHKTPCSPRIWAT